MEESAFRSSQDNLSNIQSEKKLDDKKKRKDAAAAAPKKIEKPAIAATGKVKTKTKGKGKKAVVLDSDANNNSQLAQDAANDLLEERDDNGLDKKGSDRGRDIDQFEDDDIDWLSDLDVDVIINRKYDRDPYLTACEAIGAIPITFISQNLGNHELVMRHHGLGVLGSRAFGKVLEFNESITRLDLTGNCMELGGKYFAKSLCSNHAIKYLNLSNNSLKQTGEEIANMIAENNTIQTLILSRNGFGDQEMILFSESIKKNQSLKALDLSHNQIGDIGALSIGQGIAGNDSLNEFDISWNEIRVRGIIGFLNAVKDNQELTSLNVAHNGIGDVGNQLIAFLSKTNIVRLNIGYSRIGDSQFAAFLRGLESNRSIQELDISGNPLTAPSLQAIFKSIPSTKINLITLKDIRFTKEVSLFIEGLRKDAAFRIDE